MPNLIEQAVATLTNTLADSVRAASSASTRKNSTVRPVPTQQEECPRREMWGLLSDFATCESY